MDAQMIKSTQTQAQIDEIRLQLKSHHAQFLQHRATLTKLEENLRSLRAAATAAEQEARQHREALREMMRETAGKPDRKLRQKSADQRAAIELSEDYASIAVEAETEIKRTVVAMSEPAGRVVELRRLLLQTFAQALLDEAIEEIAPRLKLALEIQRRQAGEPFNDRVLLHWGDADELMKSDLLKTIAEVLDHSDAIASIPDDLGSVLETTGVGDFKPLSPAQRINLTRELDASTSAEAA